MSPNKQEGKPWQELLSNYEKKLKGEPYIQITIPMSFMDNFRAYVEHAATEEAVRKCVAVLPDIYHKCDLDGDDTDHRKGYKMAIKDIALSLEALIK